MDSFYDVPRRAPAPTRIEKMNIGPSVPEVSLICQSNPTPNNCDSNSRLWSKENSKSQIPYTNMNQRKNTLKELHHNYSNGNLLQSTQFRKQVRFESPVFQQRPSLTYEPFATRKMDSTGLSESVSTDNIHGYKMAVTTNCNLPRKQSFQEIYMANIPNRHLDLSIIDIPKISASEISSTISETGDTQKNKENVLPKTYKEFLETQKRISEAQKKDNTVTDILNYKRQSVGILNDTSPNFSNSYWNEEETNRNIFRVSNNFSPRPSQFKKLNYQCVPHATTNSKCVSTNENLLTCGQDISKKAYLPSKENINEYGQTDNKFNPGNDELSQVDEPFIKKPCNENTDNCEPTNRDLLKIIAQQNEQLLLLQKQVALLLNREHNCQNKSIEPAPTNSDEKCSVDSEPTRFIPEINLTPRKHGLSKFSVDVMTSFEVAIRPQHNRQAPLNYNSSKIQEITEEESSLNSATDINKKTKEHSLHLQEPMKLIEPCPSPEPSININMNDYDSSDDEVSASEIGATFYHNLMGQVNNILKQAQIQTRDDLCSKGINVRKNITCSKTNITMHRVREATLRHLRDIGVTIGPLGEDDNICTSPDSDNREYSPTEISQGVKQLLMKYLPDEHSARVLTKPKQQKCGNNKDVHVIKESEHDFSFASLQYMKKYNLLPPSDIQVRRNKYEKTTDSNDHKILDLTALKLQPKLL